MCYVHQYDEFDLYVFQSDKDYYTGLSTAPK